jgi:hypothetical protein
MLLNLFSKTADARAGPRPRAASTEGQGKISDDEPMENAEKARIERMGVLPTALDATYQALINKMGGLHLTDTGDKLLATKGKQRKGKR